MGVLYVGGGLRALRILRGCLLMASQSLWAFASLGRLCGDAQAKMRSSAILKFGYARVRVSLQWVLYMPTRDFGAQGCRTCSSRSATRMAGPMTWKRGCGRGVTGRGPHTAC